MLRSQDASESRCWNEAEGLPRLLCANGTVGSVRVAHVLLLGTLSRWHCANGTVILFGILGRSQCAQ
jgi:hypothetical protein